MRRPRRRATTSVPKRFGAVRPAASAACLNCHAWWRSPSATTSWRSTLAIVAMLEPSAVVVVPVVVVPVVVSAGARVAAGGEPSSCWRPAPRSVSVCMVSGAFGWNVLTLLAPMSPCATTVAISGFAQLGGVEDEPAVEPVAAVARRAARIAAVARVASF